MSSSTVSTTLGNVVVVTHVHPVAQGPEPQHQQHFTKIEKFKRMQPVILGTVQIMIGVVALLFGISMAINADTLGVFSGIFVWGAAVYIAAGAVTVSAGKSLTYCRVNGALGLSVIATLFSGTGIILYSLDAAGVIMLCSYYVYPDYNNDYNCTLYKTRTQGISGILVFFHLLEFIISIVVAGYGCTASCNCCENPTPIVVMSAPAQPGAQTSSISVAQPSQPTPIVVMSAPAQPGAQTSSISVAQPSQMEIPIKHGGQPEGVGLSEPPAYTTVN